MSAERPRSTASAKIWLISVTLSTTAANGSGAGVDGCEEGAGGTADGVSCTGAVGEGAAPQDFAGLTRDSQCAVTVDSGGRPYQGIVEITGASLAASLEHYFDRSMQVPSHIALVADADVAAGVLLQQVPGEHMDPDDWNRLHYLVQTLSTSDFGGEAGLQLIGKLFAEDDVRVYAPRPVNFRCRCSATKTEDVLRMLGEAEAREALSEQDRIEVTCEYCGRRRYFDAVDIERLFSDNVVSSPDSLH